MKFYQEHALITLFLYSALNEVQGRNDAESFANAEKGLGESFAKRNLLGSTATESNVLKQRNLNNTGTNYLVPAKMDSLKQQTPMKKPLPIPDNSRRSNIPAVAIIYTTATQFKTAKSFERAVSKITKSSAEEKNNFIATTQRTLQRRKIYCRQIKKSELNSQGNIIDSIQHICEARPPAADHRKPEAPSTPSLPYATKQPYFGHFLPTTSRGINCRRVMNSELNELGEIVDSVTEVCDTPTSTTTTRKPTGNTTPKLITTTSKPLVKVCRPVMNSYLNEEGKIIDSVAMICKMEQVK